jgi:hypothetical protein
MYKQQQKKSETKKQTINIKTWKTTKQISKQTNIETNTVKENTNNKYIYRQAIEAKIKYKSIKTKSEIPKWRTIHQTKPKLYKHK